MNSNSNSKWTIAMVAAAVSLVGVSISRGTTYVGNSGSVTWDVATSWTPNGIPTASDTAEIGYGNTCSMAIGGLNDVASTIILGNGTGTGSLYFDGYSTSTTAVLTVGGGTGTIQEGTTGSNVVFTNGTKLVTINAANIEAYGFAVGQGSTYGYYVLPLTQTWTSLNANSQIAGHLTVGNGNNHTTPGGGDLIIQGTVNVGSTTIASYSGATTTPVSTLELDGGTLNTSSIALGTNGTTTNGLFLWNGGTIENAGGLNLTVSGPNLQLASGTTNSFSISSGKTGTVSSALVDQTAGGALTVSGPGTLQLAAANTYTGATYVNNGTLQLVTGGSIANSSGIELSTGTTLNVNQITATLPSTQSLTGSGTVYTSSLVTINGILTPETYTDGTLTSTIGTLTFSGGTNAKSLLQLSSTSLSNMAIQGFGSGQFDQITDGPLGGTVTFGGTLDVNMAGVTGAGSAQIFNFTAYSSDFSSIVFSNLANGLSASFNATTGTVNVTMAAIPEPAALGLMVFAGTGLLLVGRKRKQA